MDNLWIIFPVHQIYLVRDWKKSNSKREFRVFKYRKYRIKVKNLWKKSRINREKLMTLSGLIY